MKRLSSLFRSLTRVDNVYSDPFDQLQARHLVTIILTLIALAVGYIAVLFLSGVSTAYVVLYAGAVVLFIVGLGAILYLVKNNGLNEARITIVALIYLVILLAYVPQPTTAGMLMFVLPIVIGG